MSTKDRYDNNIRRGARVRDLSPNENGDGTAGGTDGQWVLVQWDDSEEEERVRGRDLLVTDRRFR